MADDMLMGAIGSSGGGSSGGGVGGGWLGMVLDGILGVLGTMGNDASDSASSGDTGDGGAVTSNWWEKFGAALSGAGGALSKSEKPENKKSLSLLPSGTYQGSSQPAKNPALEALAQNLLPGMTSRK